MPVLPKVPIPLPDLGVKDLVSGLNEILLLYADPPDRGLRTAGFLSSMLVLHRSYFSVPVAELASTLIVNPFGISTRLGVLAV